MEVQGGGTVTGRVHPRPRAIAGGGCRKDRPALFAAAGHLYTSPEVALDRISAQLQTTELLGNRANAQNAGAYRENLLLPLSATLAYSARQQRAFCSHLVVRNL